ncbi:MULTISPECIES: DUF6542 domain-containing protein [unclassified Rhodococcus (in: high G+C Gram-positive bacteria)]|uniref:DUF6542 domain-containing protein n=1 Tax=unclassified Rhodococcus (in: high G+C Gram-positive bacteria) TaxID=192944 RepID=UPI0009EC0D58|nr:MULTISPECIES: DUF6542 domain-containing protein [unclassified Rhodococcus (in: high G+C Gram-positive bacteria)]
MSTSQRARSGVPLDQRSALPSVPGIPAWGAVAVAVGAVVLGFLVDAMRVGELSSTFAVLYVLGSLIAVVVVRHRGLFTAMVQPPIIMFLGVPLAYQLTTEDAGTSIKDVVLNVAVPLVDRFPLMLLTTLLVLGVGGARLALDRRPRPISKPAPRSRPAAAKSAAKARPTTDQRAATPRNESPRTRSGERRRARPEVRDTASEPRHDRTRRERPQAPREDPGYTRPTGYEPRRTGAENLSPYPAPQVRYRDRD